MRFLLDESAEFPLVAYLEELGHDVTAVAREYPHALRDVEVLHIAQQEQRILITNDRDFGELVFRRKLPYWSIILFRLGATDLEEKRQWLARVLDEHGPQLIGNFLVVTSRAVRVRRAR